MKSHVALQAIMDDQGITRVRLAESLEISPQSVDKRCNGKTVMRIDTLVKTYNALGYKIIACPQSGVGREFELNG